MEVKIIDSSKDKVKFEVLGADYTLMTLLKEKLAKDKDVVFATYSQPHPLLEGFVVTVRGSNPEKEVKRALAELKSEAKEIKAAFKATK